MVRNRPSHILLFKFRRKQFVTVLQSGYCNFACFISTPV